MRVTINRGQEVYTDIPLMTARHRYIKADVWEIKKQLLKSQPLTGGRFKRYKQ
ncbi:hypothetical protein T1J70_05170 [Lactiplantibacillus plantarum]|nr:hypothetical protein [Lactiplantibacillus plantarum]MCG5035405.1 hypothetical protein [Lactiplantibacillus plantarum]MDV2576235.1 hypothetical protein [Lactiplantibacillus plantarum]WEZ94924.1 hypothetical protein P3T69_02325 [Lactiplantibacillus plantarum]WHQ52302.1 hypothetical protein M1852_04950 [Lactiplantibacillus plantarum]WQG55902.1 hypothetical protein T1J70_05170 [Lactiplantibacillus plantarum]